MPSIEISEEHGVRYLHFGSTWIQGAMRIARPYSLELEYTRELMMPLLLRPLPWPRSVLQVGLGSASITRYLHRHRPQAKLTVVEIYPEVVAAARQFFKLPEVMENLRIEIADGHDFMAAGRARFDLIVVDGFDDQGRRGMLDSVPFYMNCRERLAAQGLLSVNFVDWRKGVSASVKRLREAFGDRMLVMPQSKEGNTIALAATGRPIRETVIGLRASALMLKADTGLDLLPSVERLVVARGSDAELTL